MAMAAAWLLAAILAAATGALTTAATNARFTVNGTELQIHPIPGDGACRPPGGPTLYLGTVAGGADE